MYRALGTIHVIIPAFFSSIRLRQICRRCRRFTLPPVGGAVSQPQVCRLQLVGSPVRGGIRSTLGQVVADPYDYSTVGTVNGRQGTTGEIPDQGIQEKQGEINA